MAAKLQIRTGPACGCGTVTLLAEGFHVTCSFCLKHYALNFIETTIKRNLEQKSSAMKVLLF